MRLTTLILCSTLMWMPASALAAPFSALYVFGDSLSDNGNLSALTGGLVPAGPYDPATVSNGPVAVQHLAASLGLPLLPVAAGGTNYAFAGAATGPVDFPTLTDPVNTADNIAEAAGLTLPVPTGILNSQVAQFLAGGPAPASIADALFFIWGGANDLGLNFARGADADPDVPAEAAARIATSIDVLYDAGARHFLVPNMPDLGLTPSGDAAVATPASILYNDALAMHLASRQLTLPDIHITAFDTFALFNQVVAGPHLYGFTNVNQPCYQGPLLGVGQADQMTVCANPDEYLFWDGSHPTARGHALLGAQLARAVPEPTTLLLALVGVAATLARRRRY